MFRSRLLKLLLVSAIACCAIVGFYAPAFASHHTSWITVMAPFSGYWNKANFAPPATREEILPLRLGIAAETSNHRSPGRIPVQYAPCT